MSNEKIPTSMEIEMTIAGKLTRGDTWVPLKGAPVELHVEFEPLTPEKWKKWTKEAEGK